MLKAKKYTVLSAIVVNNTLLLDKDVIYITVYDPVSGRPQSVFTEQRKHIATITSDYFFELEKNLIEVE